jgi:hypothetical protein
MINNMKSTTTLSLLAFLCGWLCKVNADLETVPSNIAALAGSTVTLSCSEVDLITDARIMWREYATNTGGLVVSDGKGINPTHPSADRLSITGGEFDFNLQITDVRASDAGLYFCEDINGQPLVSRGYAELIVLESDPMCDDFVPPNGIVIEQNTYNTECEMFFKGNLKPIMTWSGPTPFFSNSSNPASSVWSNVRFVAHRSMDGGHYSCVTNFTEVVGAPVNVATNAPVYRHVYDGAPLYVTWGPLSIRITPIQGSYEEGDILTCNADCKPDCTYQWTNLRTLEELSGEIFPITSDLVGHDQLLRCQAKLELLGNIRTADVFLNVSVPAVTTPTTPGPTESTTAPPPDAPCTDLTGRWSSTNPDAILCLDVDTKGNMQILIRNGTDPFFVTGNGKTVYNDYKHLGFTGVWPVGGSAGGFTGECHRCLGVEVLQLSGLHRNKINRPECGISGGTHLTNYYVMTRNGPPCRGQTLEVYDTKPGQLERMGVKAKGEIFKPLAKN